MFSVECEEGSIMKSLLMIYGGKMNKDYIVFLRMKKDDDNDITWY